MCSILIRNNRQFPGLSAFVTKMYSTSAPSTAEIEFKKVNQIGTITLNRPKQLNALNLSMVKEMHKHLDAFEKDSDVKAILIKGAGDVAFCAGGNETLKFTKQS